MKVSQIVSPKLKGVGFCHLMLSSGSLKLEAVLKGHFPRGRFRNIWFTR